MTLLGACTTRRLLSNTRTWSPPHLFLCPRANSPSIPSNSTPQRHHTTIYQKLRRSTRPLKADDLTRFANKLTYVLRRHSGRDHGLENGDDDWVSLKILLNHPEFREIGMPMLQDIMDRDIKHRFALHFDPSKRDGCWWIRARQWNESYNYLKPLRTGKGPSQVVYKTTLKEWNAHLSRNGIPRQKEDYIRLHCGIPTDTYLDDLKARDELFIFVDVEKCMKNGIRFFHPTPPPQPLAKPTHLLTKGNEYGYIPAEFFVQADRVHTKKQLIWGGSNPLMRDPSLVSPADSEKVEWPNFLKTPERNLNGFVDFAYMKKPDPEIIKEASTILAPA